MYIYVIYSRKKNKDKRSMVTLHGTLIIINIAQNVGYYNHYILFKCSSISMQNYNSSRKFESLKFLMGMDHMSAVTRDGYK